jgi:hypothetical protein
VLFTLTTAARSPPPPIILSESHTIVRALALASLCLPRSSCTTALCVFRCSPYEISFYVLAANPSSLPICLLSPCKMLPEISTPPSLSLLALSGSTHAFASSTSCGPCFRSFISHFRSSILPVSVLSSLLACSFRLPIFSRGSMRQQASGKVQVSFIHRSVVRFVVT